MYGTIAFPLNDEVTFQLGQEELFYCKAKEVITNGEVVMFSGAQGDHLLIKKADASSVGFRQEYIIGVATQTFAKNEFGYVTSLGKVRELDTTAFSEGALLWSDPDIPGGLVDVEPAPPACSSLMAVVTRSHPTEGTIFVRPSSTPEVNDLCDVDAPAPNDGDVLSYDAASGTWKAVPVSMLV